MPESRSGQGGAGPRPAGTGSVGPDPATAATAPTAGLAALDLPATFGKYFLTEKLATGGMAELYLSKIVGPGGFEKQLVIKQIHPKLSGQRHFVDLFVAEAKTLVTLAHGNIVPVYELGVIDDTYFIAMEYIDGPTLYRLTEALRRRDAPMAPAVAAWITARVLEGLDYAHRKGDGVIHRDLSPRNVMLSRDGEVKLVDFGIAVTLGAAGEDDTSQSAPTGSFPYMSPEQVKKQPLTAQSDLFSVGVLLWEMLVGHRLFARSDPDATLRAVLGGDIPRPSAEHPEVPTRLDDVVMRALERDTAARWASAGDMLAALQRYLYSLDDMPGPRDVAALVARHCPPETRRLPTHHDELADDEAPAETQPRARPAGIAGLGAAPPRPGPLTAVIPRDAAGPRGRRPSRARTETFATHVELEQILEGTAPPASDAATGGTDGEAARRQITHRPGDPALDDEREPAATGRTDGDGAARRSAAHPPDDPDDDPDDERGPTAPTGHAGGDGAARWSTAHPPGDPDDEREPTAPARWSAAHPPGAPGAHGERESGDAAAAPTAEAADPVPASARPERLPLAVPGQTAPSRGLLVLAALGALVLGGAAIAVFYQGHGAIDRPDAALRRDAAFHVAPDAAANPAASLPPDAPPPDASPPEPPPPDARPPLPPPPRDAGPPAPRHDAAPHLHPDGREPGELPPRPDAAQPSGTATLTVGAIPWGTVLLDGKPIGRTPIDHLTVPAGHHVINVTFSGEDPPRTQSYTVDLGAGETKDLVVDFTRP